MVSTAGAQQAAMPVIGHLSAGSSEHTTHLMEALRRVPERERRDMPASDISAREKSRL